MAAEPVFDAASTEKDVLIALDGIDVEEERAWSSLDLGQLPWALGGLEKEGENVLRNSVYAGGGEMGVGSPSLCLVDSPWGFSRSSDGKVTDFGVLSGGSAGFEGPIISRSECVIVASSSLL